MTVRIAVALLIAITSVSSPRLGANAKDGPTPVNGSAAQVAELEHAVGLFLAAGLTLPISDVYWYDDPADCAGHLGIFSRTAEPVTLRICSELEFVLVHELAHSWLNANLNDQDREDYVARRGLETWDSHDTEWNQRGVEHAAFIIQQNLMTHLRRLTPTWQERASAFESLTGEESPLLGL